ncbi:hypothetical protein AZO1586R_1042 [Bathymodiolus azoricus thioautotrophic gill symbiont]|uniref:Uncharacterized protein n=1 Tax=Bathymodiolus azoricus thioautotrophic gill symbiont TaxID=235205 RepID=A0ACA8ZQE0_9GAMM|nr:type-F conjugative transfer system secretin TraK [Bathymodiolus azoricus thioautotrophic gill symbiont]CAB5500093.1 hypothetical protein AZO1586R_1042 [Bathymodiolus azoricus thioautotrophic gill symbiont]
MSKNKNENKNKNVNKNKKVIVALFVSFLLSTEVFALTVMPEIRTTIPINNTDTTRIKCVHGQINSMDYSDGTGLIAKVDKSNRYAIISFQQLDTGLERKIINNKVNLGIGCGAEYYQMILDPQNMKSKTILLQQTWLELISKKSNKDNKNKTFERLLIDLIKQSRNEGGYNNTNQANQANPTNQANQTNQTNQTNQKYFYLGNLQVTLLNQVKIPGTLYQLKKFAIISNKDVDISEKDFIDKQLGNGQILALSLDDYALNSDKKYTNLHVVFNIEPM